MTWGSIRIIMDRNINFNYENTDRGYPLSTDMYSALSDDDAWGFGQVVAVALLAGPFFSFYESIYGKCGRLSITT